MNRFAVLARDCLGVAGVVLADAGVAMIYPPAALIALGLCLAGAAWLLARRG